MHEEYISNQIAVYKNSKTLVEFQDKLKYASMYSYAHIHADGEEDDDGRKKHSLIGILMKDYSKGTGQNAVTVKANISPEEAKFILTRLTAGFQSYTFQQEKIFGEKDDKGYSKVSKLRIIRATKDTKGNDRKLPWYIKNSRSQKLLTSKELGFSICPFMAVSSDATEESLSQDIKAMTDLAASMDIPIDGMVLRFDDLAYSKSLGGTGHHNHDGIAFKFEDDVYETVFRSIEWQTGRTGEIAPVAVFDTIEIDGCEVARASLHNLSFIKALELFPGCRIMVSKRNMIIPHVEDNMDRGHYQNMVPETCPCCGQKTRIYSRKVDKNRIVETLHCDNQLCPDRILKQFVHFAEKKAMNIVGLSEATLAKFIELGYLKRFHDLYHLDSHKEDIIALDGFGQKSYERLQSAINKSRNTTFSRYLVAMDIPMIGRTASRELERYFKGNLREFELAAMDRFDFTCLNDFGETMRDNIHEWFHDSDNIILWRTLQKEFNFEERKEDNTMTNMKNNPFEGRTIVATGKLMHFTRDGINSKIISLGATAGSSVTKKTDYLICGEKAGSKLAKAKELGVTILTEQQFLDMISA